MRINKVCPVFSTSCNDKSHRTSDVVLRVFTPAYKFSSTVLEKISVISRSSIQTSDVTLALRAIQKLRIEGGVCPKIGVPPLRLIST